MAEAELRHTALYLMPACSVCGGASEGRVEAKIWHTCTLLANLGSWCHPESAKKGRFSFVYLEGSFSNWSQRLGGRGRVGHLVAMD